MTSTLTVECNVQFVGRGRGSRKRPPSDRASAAEVTGQAELATLGHVTRARMSQVMSLLCLAPDVQEEVLFLPQTTKGRDPIQLHHLLPIARIADWVKQRVRWKGLIHWQTNIGLGVPSQKQRLPKITSSPGGGSHTCKRLGRVDPRLSALSIM